VFQGQWFPPGWFPPGWFPKTGADRRGGASFGAGNIAALLRALADERRGKDYNAELEARMLQAVQHRAVERLMARRLQYETEVAFQKQSVAWATAAVVMSEV
jgi:hypothetical protein